MATLSDVIRQARLKALTDSNGLTDTDAIDYANEAILDLRMHLIGKREDLFNQEAKRSITSNEINIGAYPGKFTFPTDMYLLKSIEVNLQDPTNPLLFVTPEQIDASNLAEGVTLDFLRQNQPISSPMIDVHGDWFEIFPTPTQALTNALKINYFIAPQTFVATTDNINYPESLDYMVLAYKIASIYLENTSKDNTKQEAEYEKKTNQIIAVIGSGMQTPLQSKGLPISGWQY